MEKIVIKKDTKSADFIKKVIEDKNEIRKQIKSGSPLSDLKTKDIKFVQPI